MVTLQEVKIAFPTIHAAAGSLLPRLSGTGLEKDIVLSAGLAGLRMLRESKANLAGTAPGTVVLGAVPDAEADTMSRFISSYASTNGIAKPAAFHVPDPWKPYLPELSRYEAALLGACATCGRGKVLAVRCRMRRGQACTGRTRAQNAVDGYRDRDRAISRHRGKQNHALPGLIGVQIGRLNGSG